MPGGVCAVLDYDVELMADYVSEMATRVVMPQRAVNPAFRKFVSQILSSTRLPSTTILLGMNYLAKRINMMHSDGQNNHTEGQIWRMLTIALLLGSKFLDDNTFQNKSWSEVSGIPVQELNTLEYEWLGAIQWGLYVNLDGSKDYKAWLANWKEWKEAKKRQQASHDRLATLPSPVDPDMGRSRASPWLSSWHQQQVAEYERLSSKRNHTPLATSFRHDPTVWAHPLASWPQATPLTPPDSGYGTPEYTNSTASVNSSYMEWFDGALLGSSTTSRHYSQAPAYSAFRPICHPSRNPGNYGAYYGYGHNIWEHPGVVDCNCGSCGGVHNKPPAYFAGHAYGQPVVG
ncbi:cyclin-like protein [Madurella fahalii]|uniref:Cyclin-like protein n=1 Tax=Madurella fahalii TaxID=1157608 RepID=A0ABQ0GN32_9PEZI